MKIVLFVHSIVSDWNNGHAHFLRGLVLALMQRGHQVTCCEPLNNWSTKNLFATAQAAPIVAFARRFPRIDVRFYDPKESPIDQIEELTAGSCLIGMPCIRTVDPAQVYAAVRQEYAGRQQLSVPDP
jgi:hypothetical protein